MPPRVSIIIPCYNAEAYLADTIRSSLDQTYSNVEVIVVDDGSTDGSVEVAKDFGDKIVFITGPNAGACAARNKGIERASGEYIQFIDSDDILDLNKIESQMPLVTDRGENCIVFSTGKSINMKTGETVCDFKWPDADFKRNVVLEHLPTPGPIHRRDLLCAVGGFDESLPCCQEKDLHLRLLNRGLEFHEFDKSGYLARRIDSSVSAHLPRVYETLGRVLWQAFRESKDPELTSHLSFAIARNADLLWKTKQNKLAIAAMRKANEIGGWNVQQRPSKKQSLLSLLSHFWRCEQVGIQRKLMASAS